jgi:hypothetical protein
MAQNQPKRHVIVDRIYDYWLEVALLGLPILATFASMFYSDEFTRYITDDESARNKMRFWGIISAVIIALVWFTCGCFNFSRAKRISQLESRLADSEEWVQDIFAICEGYLYVLATRSGLDFNPADRISLYAHDNADSTFLLLGRFSPNEDWRRPGRKSYPATEGCIGKAWTNDWSYIADFPSRDDPTYLQKCQEFGLEEELAKRLRMPSRFYYGWKVKNMAGNQGLAVPIIESTTIRRYQLGMLQNMVEGVDGYLLRHLMERIRPRVPSVRVAVAAGF